MASERKDSDQDEDEDPWGLNRFEEEALAGLAALRSGTAPTPERIDRSPETEASREHHPDRPVIVSTPPHSPLRTGRSPQSTSVPKILFFKLSKSLAPTYEKTLLMKLKGMGEDGTYLLYHIIADTQSTASTASRNALNAIMTINIVAMRN